MLIPDAPSMKARSFSLTPWARSAWPMQASMSPSSSSATRRIPRGMGKGRIALRMIAAYLVWKVVKTLAPLLSTSATTILAPLAALKPGADSLLPPAGLSAAWLFWPDAVCVSVAV